MENPYDDQPILNISTHDGVPSILDEETSNKGSKSHYILWTK